MALENILWHPSPNFDERDADTSIDMLVLHYTGMRTAAEALDHLTDETAKVSAHYFIDEDGQVTALVREEHRSWHAGISRWRGQSNINAHSIGIEIVNPGHEFGYRSFPKAQMTAVKALSADIVARHSIPPRNVVGHSDVAPERKEDPGELFDWYGLFEAGV
ncbi:MAG: N-acetylmuramoyl-L-alanine amidase, partial [Sneathiella sp.]